MPSNVDTSARLYRITGRVQGVGFRWWTRDAARVLGLRGWVLNLSDGCVECYATGADDVLEQFEQRLAKGPPGARVDAVERIYGARSELTVPTGFDVRR